MYTKKIPIFSAIFLFLMIFIPICFAPFFTHHIPGQMEISHRLLPPSLQNWLGTDLKGIDIWTSLLYGGRLSLTISFSVVLISTFLGTFLGLLSGYYVHTWFDYLLMRCIDIMMAFPGIILSLALASFLAPTIWGLIFTISTTAWIGHTRLIRGEVLRLREREYILAAKAMGISNLSLFWRHFLPSLLPIIFAKMTTSLSGIILLESSLSFLGLGPHTNTPTWGQLLSAGRTVIIEAPLLAIAPGIAIFIIILSANFIGERLSDALHHY